MSDSIKITSYETLDDFIKSKDNALSNVYFSDIPEICKTEKCINAELLRAAKRYDITGLYEICENSIIENFDRVDIWLMLEISHSFKMQKLFEFNASIFYLWVFSAVPVDSEILNLFQILSLTY